MTKVTDIVCRGRNGHFRFNSVEISSKGWVGFFSKRQGHNAPISFYGPVEELKGLFKYVVEQLEANDPR